MANSKTSLNGYEYGRNPKTTAPFWAGSGVGAEIDDTAVVTDKTWSSKKISDELAEKADASDLASYAKVTSVYTKSESYSKAEVDALINEIPAVDAYTKTQTDALLADKADKANTYTKAEVDALISDIPAIDAYTKAQTDSLLADKADKSDTYTKTQVDNLIPDVSGLATKTELTTGLATKADAADLANYAKVTSVYTKSQTYTKTEVDALISGIPSPDMSNYYTKSQVDGLLNSKADAINTYTVSEVNNLLADKANASDVYTETQVNNLLSNKADSANVYTKSQTYTKSEVDNLISGAGGDSVFTYSLNSAMTYSSAIKSAVSAFRANVSGEAASKLKEIVCKNKFYSYGDDSVNRYRYKVVNINAVVDHNHPTSNNAKSIRFTAVSMQYSNGADMSQLNDVIYAYDAVGDSDDVANYKRHTFYDYNSTGQLRFSTDDYTNETLSNGPWAIYDTGTDKTWVIEFVYG